MSVDQVSNSLEELSINKDTKINTPTCLSKPKATFDKVALRERWKILGTDAEQSNSH